MVRIKSYPTEDRLAWTILGLVAFAVLFVAIQHEFKRPDSGIVGLISVLLLLVPSGVYCFALASATVLVSGESVQKEYFGICVVSVRISAIVSAQVAAWGLRNIDRGPYLRLSITDTHGRKADFSAPREQAREVFDSIVESIRTKKPNQSPEPMPLKRHGSS